jgi:type IV pilus assembly protein PilF
MPAPEWCGFSLLAAMLLLLSGCTTSADRQPRPDYSQSVAAQTDATEAAHKRARQRSRLLSDVGMALDAGDLSKAEGLARRAIGMDSSKPDGYTTLAVILELQGRADVAGQAYRQALALAPAQGDLLNNYGAWLCGQGHPADALVLLDRAMADPDYQPLAALANAGTCALRSGQLERAGRDLRSALTLAPEHPQALVAMSRLQLQRGNAMAARAFYQRRLHAASADASVLQLAAEVEEALGDMAAAEHHKQQLRMLQGHSAAAPEG